MWPQAKEFWQLLVAGGGKGRIVSWSLHKQPSLLIASFYFCIADLRLLIPRTVREYICVV